MRNIYNELKEIDIKIIGVYLLIASSIMYLVIFNNQKIDIMNKIIKPTSKNETSNDVNLTKIIVITLLIANSIFLYYSYQDLQQSIIKYKKTGQKTSLNASYNSFYANLLQFIATLIISYNTFIKDTGEITVL